MFDNGEHSFFPGRLVRRKRLPGLSVDDTHFEARLAIYPDPHRIFDEFGRIRYHGRIELSYDSIGMCVKEEWSENGKVFVMLVLNGEHLVLHRSDYMEPYDV